METKLIITKADHLDGTTSINVFDHDMVIVRDSLLFALRFVPDTKISIQEITIDLSDNWMPYDPVQETGTMN